MDDKLNQASKAFDEGRYNDAMTSLNDCPQHDAKIWHNKAIADYLSSGGMNTLELIYKLGIASNFPTTESDHATAPPGNNNKIYDLPTGVGQLSYVGHEVAYYNRAIVLLHNGLIDDSLVLIRDLMSHKPPVAAPVLIRAALVLQLVTTTNKNSKKIRTGEDDTNIGRIITEHMSTTIKNDPTLERLMKFAFASNSDLHDWFYKGTDTKTKEDNVTYATNLGIMAINDNKLHLAAAYFARALDNVDSKVDKLIVGKVYYNAGICALLRKQYGAALSALVNAQTSMEASPLLWMRIAQAAIGKHNVEVDAASTQDYAKGQDQLATSFSRSARLVPGFQLLQVPGILTINESASSADVSLLDTALKSISNVLVLLVPNGKSLQQAVESLHNNERSSLFRVLQYTLGLAVYAELRRGNTSVAYSIAQDTLALHRYHKLLPDVLVACTSYTVEALLVLNKPSAALKLLQGMNASELITAETQLDHKQRVEAIFINLVVTHIAQGNWKQAQPLVLSLLSKFNLGDDSPTSKVATLLQIYIEIAQGNREKAIEFLRKTPFVPPLLG